MSYYRIQISTANESIHDSVTEILGISPTFHDESYQIWAYVPEDDMNDFVNFFMDILEPKLSKLEEIGIKPNAISIWRIYDDDQPGTMEVMPQEMKRLGENGITLYVNCFQVKQAHLASSSHRPEIESNNLCGCFHCLKTFSPSEIVEWIEEPKGGETAVCPKCGVDSVLSAEYAITDPAFLMQMQMYWFS